MMFALKALVTILSIYAAIRLSGIGMAWMKEIFDGLKPRKHDDY